MALMILVGKPYEAKISGRWDLNMQSKALEKSIKEMTQGSWKLTASSMMRRKASICFTSAPSRTKPILVVTETGFYVTPDTVEKQPVVDLRGNRQDGNASTIVRAELFDSFGYREDGGDKELIWGFTSFKHVVEQG